MCESIIIHLSHLAGVLATLGQAGANHRVKDGVGIGVGPEYFVRVRRNKHE